MSGNLKIGKVAVRKPEDEDHEAEASEPSLDEAAPAPQEAEAPYGVGGAFQTTRGGARVRV